MAYSELIKNFNKIRDYMRDFYVYGFKSRDDYTKKSARSYDDEKRRIESWLRDYMKFHQTADGKNVFLAAFEHARVFDISTIRKKLNEYVKEGLLVRRKSGKTMLYSRIEELEMPSRDLEYLKGDLVRAKK